MKFFLDTANLNEIRTVKSWHLLDGVTTNPSHVAREKANFIDLVKEICTVCGDKPVSAEVISLETKGIVEEARRLAKVAPNIVIKVPVTRDGMCAIAELSKDGIRTNATACYSSNQALIAAKVGATYISAFVGRLDFQGHDGMNLVREIRTMYDNYDFKTEIIVAAVRHPAHVIQSALAGAHVLTMYFSIMQLLLEHPGTDAAVKQFMLDWSTLPEPMRKF